MAPFQEAPGTPIPPRQTYDATLEYLKVINEKGRAGDPQLIVLLMAQYMNANQRPAGIEYFGSVLEQHQSDMSPEQHALYLSALATLRATHSVYVPMMKRVPWVKESVTMLERARALTQNDNFLVRWMSGLVYAQYISRLKHRTPENLRSTRVNWATTLLGAKHKSIVEEAVDTWSRGFPAGYLAATPDNLDLQGRPKLERVRVAARASLDLYQTLLRQTSADPKAGPKIRESTYIVLPVLVGED